MTGFGHEASGHQTSEASASPRTGRVSPGIVLRSARSVPAQKAPPVPVTISTRHSSSSPARPTVVMKSASIAKVIALRFSGRSMVIVPMPPSAAYRMCSLTSALRR